MNLTEQRPLALRNLTKASFTEPKKLKPVSQWSWTPSVSDPSKLTELVASGGNSTSRTTFSNQTDHGESY